MKTKDKKTRNKKKRKTEQNIEFVLGLLAQLARAHP